MPEFNEFGAQSVESSGFMLSELVEDGSEEAEQA